jgi:hypothetical protein
MIPFRHPRLRVPGAAAAAAGGRAPTALGALPRRRQLPGWEKGRGLGAVFMIEEEDMCICFRRGRALEGGGKKGESKCQDVRLAVVMAGRGS